MIGLQPAGHVLPVRYMQHDFDTEWHAAGAAGGYGAGTWPAANRAIYVPVVIPADCLCFGITAIGANATGNYDIGLYNYDFTRLTNKGSTAMAATPLTHTFTDIRLYGGYTYWQALALSSTSGSLARLALGSLPKIQWMMIGQEASALPLPATMTPATAANDYVPTLILHLR